MRRRTRRAEYWTLAGLIVILIAGVVLLFAGPNSTGSTQQSSPTSPKTRPHIAQPAGPTPSKSAQMVCARDANKEINSALGVATVQPLAPTWIHHQYSCRYVYPNGTMTVSVKELSSKAETDAYFTALRTYLGVHKRITGVAQGAFITTHGSVVVRKDYKVLLVDTSGLPSGFGQPPAPRSEVGVDVALTVLGCWTGA